MPKETLPTQELIPIEEIKNDTIILSNGGLRKVLIVSGVNFELKSEKEQELIIYTYQDLINSLNFPIQQLIHTRKLNIENYLIKIGARHQAEGQPLLKNLIDDYQKFIANFVSQNPIMTKSFFLIIPYEPIAGLKQAGKAVKKSFLGFFRRQEGVLVEAADEDFRELEQRTEKLVSNLAQIGLRALPLNREEILELLYNLYNQNGGATAN